MSSTWTAAMFAAVSALMVVLAATARAAEEQGGDDQARIDRGKATYAERCSHCHGPGMMNSGTITPDLRGFPDDRPRFVTTVKNGKNNRMPPWGDVLSDDEIRDLWAYISSRRRP